MPAGPEGNAFSAARPHRMRRLEDGHSRRDLSPLTGSGQMASIELDGVSKLYGDVVAVSRLDLDCPDGEMLALLGPSGCGKSSTLKMIAGIENVSAGEIRFGGRTVNALGPSERNLAMVFEDYALYPH